MRLSSTQRARRLCRNAVENFHDIFSILGTILAHWSQDRPSGHHFRAKGAPKGYDPFVRRASPKRSVHYLSPLSVARATLHVQRRTCNVQRRSFDAFSSFFIEFSSHLGSIFVYFWHVFASILPILFSHCNVQRRISNCSFLLCPRF